MDRISVTFWMTFAGTACWGVCFWWMRRISDTQNAMLARLQEQAKRIEKLSKIEHDLIKDVHPQVGEIKEGMEEIRAVMKENTEITAQAAKDLKATKERIQ